MPRAKKPTPKKPAAPKKKPAAPKFVRAPAKPPPPPDKHFLVRCSFVGEDKKKKLNGSFRFVATAADTSVLYAKLEKAVNKLRRTGELPPRADVYIEFLLELADLPRGVLADFERWEQEPRKFQQGSITSSDACVVYHVNDPSQPSFRFGKVAAAEATTPVAPADPAAGTPGTASAPSGI